ncbi:MAG: sensor histidine kinase [Lautropia sp.]
MFAPVPPSAAGPSGAGSPGAGPSTAEAGPAGRIRQRLPTYVVVVLIADTLIAALLTAVAPATDTFLTNLIYSQAIGFSILVLMLVQRAVLLRGQAGSQLQEWALFAIATALGFLLGHEVAAHLLGHPTLLSGSKSGHSLPLIVMVTIVATTACSLFFWARERVSALHLEAARQRERAEIERTRAESASRQATEAQLNLIRTQLEPHMLFNTLANLRSLMTIDPPRAQQMMDRLIAYLRATLSASRRDTVTLADEFRLLRDYLELIAIRMGPRLAFTLDLPPALAGTPILPLLLQPLVENAIRHGLEPALDGGRIAVRAVADGAQLRLTVEDTGLGFETTGFAAPPPAGEGGFGLAQIRERLRTAYGDAAELRIESPRPDAVAGAGRPAEAGLLPGALLTLTLPLAGSGGTR